MYEILSAFKDAGHTLERNVYLNKTEGETPAGKAANKIWHLLGVGMSLTLALAFSIIAFSIFYKVLFSLLIAGLTLSVRLALHDIIFNFASGKPMFDYKPVSNLDGKLSWNAFVESHFQLRYLIWFGPFIFIMFLLGIYVA